MSFRKGLGVLFLGYFASPLALGDFRECRVAQTTQMRISEERVEKGLLAVLMDGTVVRLEDILADAMIHFQDENGRITDTYQWMYSSIQRLGENEYHSKSYGENVTIRIEELEPASRQTVITYTGSQSGHYLTLLCR